MEVPNLLYNYFLREYFFSDDKESRGSLRDLLVSIEKKHAQRALIENVVMIDLNQALSDQINDTPLAISKLSNKRKIQFSDGIHDLLIRQSLYNMIEEPKLEEYFLEERD